MSVKCWQTFMEKWNKETDWSIVVLCLQIQGKFNISEKPQQSAAVSQGYAIVRFGIYKWDLMGWFYGVRVWGVYLWDGLGQLQGRLSYWKGGGGGGGSMDVEFQVGGYSC